MRTHVNTISKVDSLDKDLDKMSRQ